VDRQEAGSLPSDPTVDAPPRTPAPRPSRIRTRALLVAALTALVVVGGLYLERELGVRPAAGAPEFAPTGAWFCPHGGGEGMKGWAVITNPNPHPVRIRLTTFGPRGPVERRDFSVPATSQQYRAVRTADARSATEVEYFGGSVAAAWVLQRTVSAPATGASRCSPSSAPSWYAPDLPTGEGQTSYLVVTNPFAEEAVFHVVFRTDQRLRVTPSVLTPMVLAAGTTTAVRVNRVLLQAPKERIVTAEVHMKVGRVIAGGLSVSNDGIGTEVGVPLLARRWVLPAADFEDGTTINLMQPQSRPAHLTVLGQGLNEDRLLTEGPGTLALEPEQVRAFGVEDTSAVGLVVEVEPGARVAAQRHVVGAGGDPALIGGSLLSRSRWVVLPTLPPTGGRTTLVLENPGQDQAMITLELIGPEGTIPAGVFEHLTVSPGRSLTVDLSRIVGDQPVSALLTATEGTVVAGGASYASDDAGYAATLGVPARQGR
jgi:Family of unknown function (DUF5719)